MRLLLQVSTLFIALLTSHLSVAQTVVAFSPEKAMFATQAAKQLGQQLNQQLAPQTQRLQELGAEIQALQQRHQQDQALMSADEVQALEQEIQLQSQEYRKLQQYINNAKVQTEQKFLASMKPRLDAVLRTYIETNNVGLIVNSSAVIYAAQGIDVTAEIATLLDQE
jgi:outer membrane protein